MKQEKSQYKHKIRSEPVDRLLQHAIHEMDEEDYDTESYADSGVKLVVTVRAYFINYARN
jgi:hypothetical protein